MMGFRLVATVAVLGALAACDPISEEECRAGNWTGIGLSDGKAGRPASRLNDYAEICSELGIAPNRAAYLAARDEGLKTYCTPLNAYRVGRSGGNEIGDVCPAASMSELIRANERGQQFYEAEQDIERYEERIDELEERLSSLAGLDTKEAQAERVRLRSRVRDARWDIRRAENRLRRYDYW